MFFFRALDFTCLIIQNGGSDKVDYLKVSYWPVFVSTFADVFESVNICICICICISSESETIRICILQVGDSRERFVILERAGNHFTLFCNRVPP